MAKIGDEFDVSSGGTPPTKTLEYWEGGTINWIGSNLCQNTIITKTDGKFITELGLKNSSAKIFEPETVLVALVGATIGKTALLRIATSTNQNIAGIAVWENRDYASEYVFYAIQHLYPKFMEVGEGKFAMANLGFIRELKIMKPPVELQNDFAKFCVEIYAAIANCQKISMELSKNVMEFYGNICNR